MGGRYKTGKQYAGQYSNESVDFWLTDPRVLKLSALARCALFYLGLLAVKERRECLPIGHDWAQVGRTMGDSRAHIGRDMGRVGRELGNGRLIDEAPDGRIIVCGAKKRTPNLVWKDEGNIVGIRGYIVPQAVSSKHETGNGAIAPGSKSREEQKRKPVQLPDGRWEVVELAQPLREN